MNAGGAPRVAAVALVSAATLAFEVLLVRVFSITQYHHFAYMAIGVAMFGIGASGTLVALRRPLERAAAGGCVGWALAGTALALIVCPALALRIRLDPTQLVWESGQWPRLLAVYLLLALPFACGSLVVLLALAAEPGRTGRIYGASLLGSGIGAAFGAFVLVRPPWPLHVTPYKELPQVEAYPGARRVAEHFGPLGWVVAARAPAFRWAPGLSLGYRGAVPRQTALFVDGALAGAATDSLGGVPELLDWLPAAVPYALGRRERVLVIGAGGSLDVELALAHGARRVTALELNPDLARLGAAALRGDERAVWVVGDARSYVARTSERFDLVAIGPGGAFGGAVAGVHALGEDFLHTREAYAQSLRRLGGNGVLALTRWLTTPAREAVRVILTAAEALDRVQAGAAGRGLVVMHGWGTVTVLIKPSLFTAAELALLQAWTRGRQFDLDWYPGLTAPLEGLHQLGEPVLFRAAAAAVAGPAAAAWFAAEYPFWVAPAADARPYPHQFLRLRSLGRLLARPRGDWLPFAEWGSLALVATLGQGVVLALLLLALPAALARGPGRRPPARVVLYFAAIGLGYLAAELAAVQQLGLLLGHPVYAVAAALAAFLVGSGLGSVWSDRVRADRAWRAGAALLALLAAYAVSLLGVVHLAQGAPLLARVVVALLALGPPAFLMGLPFPLGLRALVGERTAVLAWAWAANGFASVIAAPLAALIALGAGSRVLFLFAAAAYGVAALAALRVRV
ncbi:MAG: hypothetical protein A2083_10330 [Gemmatimonadetes bacterium GWC2_71_9]|nr:MAG: hypothetical protein A2083_10330 [Gemmatimonadetes bacterium GWC2_71_9]